uniref:RNA-directed DNA polymerase n=1 Tax=Lactuca sativa TaxID=4236 RepID=A0A9R1UN84_LACSA|nr:hypothetical protein LSAT_V11C800453960 [Lactuca sativa]
MKKDTTPTNVQIEKNTLTKSRFYKPLTMEAMKLLNKSMMVRSMFLYIMLRQNLHQTLKNTNQQRMTQTSPIHTSLFREEEIDDSLIMNLTNPNSIYVSAFLNFKGYKKFRVHCFVDIGASLCLASKFIIPDELWENAPKEISATIANGETIKINKVCKNINLELSGEHFNVPTIYQQNSGIDIIIGNNFCQVYGPFIQWIDRIAFHLNNDMVIIKKVTEAYSKGKPGCLETQEKGSKEKQIPGTNITHEEINKERIISIQTTRFKQIEDLLEKVCSENPIDPNKTKGWMKASIKLIDPKTVIREKPMVYSVQDREEFSKQIKELLDMRLIIESKSPHMSPAFLVNKEAEKRRGKKRMVVNYKAINDATIGDSHNLPNMHELLTLLRGKNIYSSIDCKSGFWQVLLDEESQLLTAFTCPDGLFQWKVLPFGLKQAPSIFQRHMQNALRGLEGFCTVYVDDIMIFSKNEQEHYVHVTQVLRTILKYGIILSKKKSHLFKTKINFLGLEINEGTHCPQKHILEHLHDFPNVLEDKKQLQRFLGVLTYAETYIEKLVAMRKPLQAKLKKDVIWIWSNADTDYIKKIKKVLINFPKLYLPNIEDSLIIETDASDEFWGGVLKAKNPKNEEQICRYTSGSFKAAEKNYHSNEKELLAETKTYWQTASPVTSDLNTLRMKKQMLLIELSAIEQKINLYEQVSTVTNVPESESSKTKAIPVQTAPGISNMTTLSPINKSVQEFTPDYKKALNKEAEIFYVIYKGPHAGVHTDWGITETFCKVDKVTCKKFRNETSARLSLATYQDDTSKTNQTLLRPKIQKVKEAHRDQRFDVPNDVQQMVNYPEISFEDFRTIWKKARAACPEDLVHEKFFTTDKKTKSLFNFLEGANAKLVYQAFQAGLIDNIYPSCNLQELKFFPSSMVDSIKNFRKKVLKAKDSPIYIRCISSLPEWIQESTLSPYHFLEIGLSKANREIEQSQPMEDKDLPFTEILHPNRINGLRRIS